MAESTSHQASTAARPTLKRTLFSKPSWVQQDNSTSSTDFFRRSNQSYLAIAAEAERKRQRKQARKRQEQAHQDKDARRTHKQPRTPSVSDSADDSDHSKIDDGRCSQPDKEQIIPLSPITQLPELKQLPIATEPESSLKSLSKRYESVTSTKETNGKSTLPPSNVIDLEDSDGSQSGHQDHVNQVATIKHSTPVEDDDDLPPSDDEYAELVRKAREKARRKRLEDDIPCPAIQKDRLSLVGSMNQPNPPPATADPAVSILITSRIPNTNPLIVNRKVSQRLKDVRLAWCHRQQFEPDTTEAVFLTWKGKRLFDVTTCRSLGIGVDSQGNIMTNGRRDILGDEEDQIHMEAMTEGILQGDQRAKRQDTENAEHDEMEAHEQALAVKRKEPQVRIILKAKGFDDFKLIVKPTTPISRIVNAFKMDKQIEDSREVFLSFDGDRLAPEIQVTNTELTDMDYIDVYVK
ncbi:MAG: hypothetical protein LQ339_007260 [Xanthoria mediterranea]|nr:MAG: hypothetical protein LQ339_007260 [Xanthoria mediterranea]